MQKKKYQFPILSRRLFIGSLVPLITAISCTKGKDSVDEGGSPGDDLPDIPDKEGMTVKGRVYSGEGTGVPDVVVSDGIVVAKTDANGIYYLPSTKAMP